LNQRIENAVDIPQNVMIPESHDVVPGFLQHLGARCILPCPLAVLSAVNFNNEFQVKRDKIDDKPAIGFCRLNLTPAKRRSRNLLHIAFSASVILRRRARASPLITEPPHPALSPAGRGFLDRKHPLLSQILVRSTIEPQCLKEPTSQPS
jgi:hypothetical protein